MGGNSGSVGEDEVHEDGRMTPFRTAVWMVVAMSLLMGVGVAAVDSGPPWVFVLASLASLVILGVPLIVVAAVVRWLKSLRTSRQTGSRRS